MEFYRVKQFLWAMSSTFKDIDTKFLDKYLDDEEKDKFMKLKKSDKHHCIRVCKDCIDYVNKNYIDIDKNKLAKAALLHDIGKIEYGLNAIEKSILVLVDKATSSKIKKYNNIKMIDVYYNHPKKGELVLQKIKKNYDNEIMEVILNHHNEEYKTENEIFNMIRFYDNKN